MCLLAGILILNQSGFCRSDPVRADPIRSGLVRSGPVRSDPILVLPTVFLKHGGQISVEVTGNRRNKGIGIEFPATYSMYYKKPSKVKKLIELIRDKEDRAEVSLCL